MGLTSLDLGGGGNSFPFDTVGASVTGRIVNLSEMQQNDMETGKPAFWEDGQPKMMVAVELATDIRDPENPSDDGKRTVYLRGSKKPESQSSLAAVLVAVRNASGATTLSVNGTLTLSYVGDGVPSRRGYNAPKLYEARYVAPSVNLDGAAPAPAPATAPAAAPVAQPAPAPAAVPGLPPGMTAEQFAAFQQYQQSQAQPA